MEPKIRYAKSADGVNIAYWVIGEGRPLVYLPTLPFSHIEREWAVPEWRRRYERLATGRSLVRYDSRGLGLSDPNPEGVSLADHAGDLEAVLDALAIDECDLFAPCGDAGMIAIEFCARTGDRVGRLILWNAYASRLAVSTTPQVKSLRALWDQDWHTYTETATRTIFQWKHAERATQIAKLYRAAATKETIRNVMGALDPEDVTKLLPAVHVLTTVVIVDGTLVGMRDEARRLAAGLPNAELRTVHGETGHFDFYDDEDAVVTVVNDFLGGSTVQQSEAGANHSPAPSAFRAVLFTDLVGHTEMMSRLGDAQGREVLREHERITREVLKAHDGTEIKTDGDSFMVSFGSATRAVECAVALQRAFAEREGEPLSVRMGLNAGEPIEEDGPDGRVDLFGATVILASRIAAKAEGGEILVADTVRGLCSGKGFLFADRGDFVAKGFEEPVRVYEVRWRE